MMSGVGGGLVVDVIVTVVVEFVDRQNVSESFCPRLY